MRFLRFRFMSRNPKTDFERRQPFSFAQRQLMPYNVCMSSAAQRPEARATQSVNKEAIRILVQDHGYKIASQISGVAEPTIRQWAHRGQWNKPLKTNTRAEQLTTVTRVTPSPAQAHSERLQGHRERSLTHLAQYAEDSGKRLADSDGDLRYSKQFQQVAAGRSNLFPEQVPSNQVNIQVLSFAEIRPVERDDSEAVSG